MTKRQYLFILVTGFFISITFPSMEDRNPLDVAGPIYIYPGAGVQQWPGFYPAASGTLVSEINRKGKFVSFKLVIRNSLFLVDAQCIPLSNIRIDPDLGVDEHLVQEAVAWVCSN